MRRLVYEATSKVFQSIFESQFSNSDLNKTTELAKVTGTVG